jgi:hypothetical protein
MVADGVAAEDEHEGSVFRHATFLLSQGEAGVINWSKLGLDADASFGQRPLLAN